MEDHKRKKRTISEKDIITPEDKITITNAKTRQKGDGGSHGEDMDHIRGRNYHDKCKDNHYVINQTRGVTKGHWGGHQLLPWVDNHPVIMVDNALQAIQDKLFIVVYVSSYSRKERCAWPEKP
eukprot:15346706-Ditylum_brightwellii.AAC.1